MTNIDKKPELKSTCPRLPKRIMNCLQFMLMIPAIGLLRLPAASWDRGPEAGKSPLPTVFLQCNTCDSDYFRSEIRFVHYVADPGEAQIKLMISKKMTGSGPEEYIIRFQGQKQYEGDDDELKYVAEDPAQTELIKKDLVGKVKMGLMRYIGKTDVSQRISVDFLDKVKPTAVTDPWNFWVFNLSSDIFLNGEQTLKSAMYFGSFSANRVTPEWKIRASVGGMYEKTEFDFSDTVIKSSTDSMNFRGMIVKSLNEHWSVGGYFETLSATYSNVELILNPAPSVEFNVFPYQESTRRQLRLLYRLNFKAVNYREETIYEKTKENLWGESLAATLELNQKWGTISTTLEGSHYFHDLTKNRLELSGDISFRLIKGLNFNIYGSYSRIHDQISLPRAGASYEDVLLRRRQLETNYDFYFSMGLSFTFGSTASKVVNPRFGSSGGTSISITM